jgi:hypothetical protein
MQSDQSLRGAADGVPRRRHDRQMTVTEQGLVLGAGTLLAKMGEDGLGLDGEEERILTLLAIAYRGDVPGAALGMFRRVSKHWQGGDKCLAAIHLAQSGLPEIDEDAATCLSLAAELIEAGMMPRELARQLGLNPVQFDVSKYDENQPRVPAGNGRASGQGTSGDAAGEGRTRRWLKEEAPGQLLGSTRCGIFPRMPSWWLGRMDQKSLIRVPQPKGSWHRHGRIFRRSLRPGRVSQTGRYQTSSLKPKLHLSNSEPMIFNETGRQTLGFPNMSMPPITR